MVTFTDWIYKWFMRGHDSPPGTGRFTCPSSQLLLRSSDMLISEAPSSYARSSVPQNWIIDLPRLFIFRFEWHSRESFQLSWSNWYFLLFRKAGQRGKERVLEVPQHFPKGDTLHSTFVRARWNSYSSFSKIFLNLILHPLVEDSGLIYHPVSALKLHFTTGTRR